MTATLIPATSTAAAAFPAEALSAGEAVSAAPTAQQPHWAHHPAHQPTMAALAAAAPLVTGDEVRRLRHSVAAVAAGDGLVLQIGDCAESFHECTPVHTSAKLAVLDGLADEFQSAAGLPVVRVGRLGGQFAKPRSQPMERVGDVELPAFRGHMVNSEVPTRTARQHDPRRMLWAHSAAREVLGVVRRHERAAARASGLSPEGRMHLGPWASHEALVLDYERPLVRPDRDGLILTSTHLPWIGERTRQPESPHVRLLAGVGNPVGCKVGPTATVDDVLAVCAALDPAREPGRLVLIARLGRDSAALVLPRLVDAVRRAGHPVVWLTDPMHGNTVRTSSGLKTRHLRDMAAEALAFRAVLERFGVHPGGLHLEVAATAVTECVGGSVEGEEQVGRRYTTLCDPRLNPEQAHELIEIWAR